MARFDKYPWQDLERGKVGRLSQGLQKCTEREESVYVFLRESTDYFKESLRSESQDFIPIKRHPTPRNCQANLNGSACSLASRNESQTPLLSWNQVHLCTGAFCLRPSSHVLDEFQGNNSIPLSSFCCRSHSLMISDSSLST